jgi:hypothetical protein
VYPIKRISLGSDPSDPMTKLRVPCVLWEPCPENNNSAGWSLIVVPPLSRGLSPVPGRCLGPGQVAACAAMLMPIELPTLHAAVAAHHAPHGSAQSARAQATRHERSIQNHSALDQPTDDNFGECRPRWRWLRCGNVRLLERPSKRPPDTSLSQG